MKRLKKNWDKIHPKCSFLTDKYLRDQASLLRKTRMSWTRNMYMFDQIITRKWMDKHARKAKG